MSVYQTARVLALQEAGLLRRGELKLLTFLADVATDAGARVYPGDARLLRQTHWTPRYLRLVRRGLLERRWLIVERPARGRRRAIYRLALPTVAPRDGAQMRLPFTPVAPVEKLLKPCASAADEDREKRICGSARADLAIRASVGEPPTTNAGATASTSDAAADPSNGIRPVQPVRTEEDPARARRDPPRGFTPLSDLVTRFRMLRAPAVGREDTRQCR